MSTPKGSRILYILFALFAAALISPFSAAAEDGTVHVTISSGPYEIQDTPEGQKVTMEGFGRLLIPGKPALPSRIFAVAIPPGATISEVSFDKGEGIPLSGEYRIAPSPVARATGEENPLLYERELKRYEANYDAVYGGDGFFPEQVGEFVNPAGYRKYNLADVKITPLTFHPKSNKLVLYPRIAVKVRYTLPNELPEDVVLYDDLPRMEMRAQEIVYNYDQAQAWYPKNSFSAGSDQYDYVIITLSTLTEAVQPIINWEQKKGRKVRLVTTAWISYYYPGYDLAAKMRNFLRDKYPSAQWGIRDVLLVGDYDSVPMRRTAQDVGYGKPETDYYFAELSFPDSQSWDKDQDLQWGEDYVDPIDFYGEVNVGRIPWSDPDTVEHICRKSAGYEKNADPAFKQNILLLGSFFWPDTDNAVLMELKTDPSKNPSMKDWTKTKLYEKNQDYSSIYPCDFELLNRNVMNDAWKKGRYSFVNWAGHGNPFACHMLGMGSGYFIVGSDATCLNDDHPSVIVANACSNSDTDEVNIGQLMLKQGAVGFLGATKVSFGIGGWSDPLDGCGSSMDYFFTLDYTSGDYTQGEALQKTITFMYTYGLFYYVKYELFEWSSLWGNPDLGLKNWGSLTISPPEGLPEGMQPPGMETKMTVQITSGLESVVAGTELLNYRFDPKGGFARERLTPLGGGLYEAVLPHTRPGDKPEFYFSVEGSGGSKVYSPTNVKEERYSFEVGFMDMVLKEDFEKESGWTVQSQNVENGEFERAIPGSTTIQPDEDHSQNGEMCFVTGKSGGSISDDDLDGGPTELISPDLHLSDGDPNIGFYLWHHQTHYGIQQLVEVHVSNDSGSTWVHVMDIPHNAGWEYYSFLLSDYVAPTFWVKVRFVANDNPNDGVVEALVDDFMAYRIIDDASLWADAYTIPVSSRTLVNFTLDAGGAHVNRSYLLLGSASGTVPGTLLPDGTVLPLNWDVFTATVLMNLNTPIFQNFMASLDPLGGAYAALDTRGTLDPALVGLELSFAYVLDPAPYFASNPITITLEP